MKKILMAGLAAFSIAAFSTAAQAVPVSEMDLDISGLAQFNYSWSEQNGRNDQLDTQRLRLIFSAQPAENVSVYAQLEGTDNTSNGANGAAGSRNAISDGVADSRVVDLYADISYLDWMTLRVGQFALPNSYELNTPEFDLETINYTQGIGTFGVRDRGFMAMGEPTTQFGWAAWITNGSSSNAAGQSMTAITGASNDNDDKSQYGVQFDYSPTESLGLKIWGMTEDETLTSPDVDAYGFVLDWVYSGFHLFGEYNLASVTMQNTAGVTTSDDDLSQAYIHLSYLIPQTDLQAVVRYDWAQDEDNVTNTEGDNEITTVGINWNFEKNARLQTMYEFVDGDDNNNLDMQLSISF